MRRIPALLLLGTLSLLSLGCPSEEEVGSVRRPSATPKPSATSKPTAPPSPPTTGGQNVGGTIEEAGEATPTPGSTLPTPSPSPSPTKRPLFEPGGPETSPSPTPTPSVDPEAGSLPG